DRKPFNQTENLEKLVRAKNQQRQAPEPAATPPVPWTKAGGRPIPAAGVSVVAPEVVRLMAPCSPLVARGVGTWLRRRSCGLRCRRRRFGGHRSDRTPGRDRTVAWGLTSHRPSSAGRIVSSEPCVPVLTAGW